MKLSLNNSVLMSAVRRKLVCIWRNLLGLQWNYYY